jgi:hypothetical protein
MINLSLHNQFSFSPRREKQSTDQTMTGRYAVVNILNGKMLKDRFLDNRTAGNGLLNNCFNADHATACLLDISQSGNKYQNSGNCHGMAGGVGVEKYTLQTSTQLLKIALHKVKQSTQ